MAVLEFCCYCDVVLRSQLTSKVMSGRSVNLTTLFLGRLRPLSGYFVHIPSPVTDNCLS